MFRPFIWEGITLVAPTGLIGGRLKGVALTQVLQPCDRQSTHAEGFEAFLPWGERFGERAKSACRTDGRLEPSIPTSAVLLTSIRHEPAREIFFFAATRSGEFRGDSWSA